MSIGSGSDSRNPVRAMSVRGKSARGMSARGKSLEALRRSAIGRLWEDERGSYTIWSIVWFMLYAAFGGVAVDVTDAYRNQTLLQSTADAAALAAVMSVGQPNEDPVYQANAYGTANMNTTYNGDVLADSDITFGNFDFENKTFTANTAPTNAVHVITRRSTENTNQVPMNFLKILALFGYLPVWDISTEAIAVGDVSTCHNNGLIAGREVTQTNANDFYENICVHGVQGLLLRQDDTFESGVAVSTTCVDCVGPDGLDPHTLEGYTEAWWRGGENDALYPLNALVVDDYVTALRALPDTGTYSNMIANFGTNYSGWRHLFYADGTAPAREKVTTLPDTLVENTVYEVDCNGNISLPETAMRNLAIVSTCRVVVPSNAQLDMENVVIAVDGDFSQPGIKIAGKGRIGQANCKAGTVELYTNGSSINFAAQGDVNNVRLISAEDVDWAAKANGRVGIMAEAVRDIKITTQSDFGLCENRVVNGPNQYTYRLVY